MKKLLKSEVCGTCEQCTDAQCTVHGRKVKSSSLKKKKKKDETRFASRHGCKCNTQTGTKQFFFFGYLFCFVNNYREKLRSNNRDCAIFSIMDENLLPMS